MLYFLFNLIKNYILMFIFVAGFIIIVVLAFLLKGIECGDH